MSSTTWKRRTAGSFLLVTLTAVALVRIAWSPNAGSTTSLVPAVTEQPTQELDSAPIAATPIRRSSTGAPWRPQPSAEGRKTATALHGRAEYGTHTVAALDCRSESAEANGWCRLENLGRNISTVSTITADRCDYEPMRQGNFVSVAAHDIWRRFPSHQDATSPGPGLRVGQPSQGQVERFFEKVPRGDDPLCHICKGQLQHEPAYSLRRWWRIKTFHVVGTEPALRRDKSPTILTLNPKRLEFQRFDLDWNEPVAKDTTFVPIQLPLSVEESQESPTSLSIVKVHFELPPQDGPKSYLKMTTTELRYRVQNDPATVVLKLHGGDSVRIQFALAKEGMLSFWRSLEALLPALAKSATMAESTEGAQRSMPATQKFPYLPCYVFRLTEKMKQCEKLGNYDKYKNHWPFSCSARREVDLRALDEPNKGLRHALSRSRPSESVRVAVAFSGFLRTFSNTRHLIWENIVKPHNADTFGATWNVVGRAKKKQPVAAKDTLSCDQMYTMVSDLMRHDSKTSINPCGPTPHHGTDVVARVDILDYSKHLPFHKVLESNGFPHGGLYFTLCRALALVQRSPAAPYDIVIRTRFDVFPTVPFHFVPVLYTPESVGPANEGEEKKKGFELDMRTSCQMQGTWFPQHALVTENLILKHYADTRFKLFTYQVCDWIEVGTHDSMMKIVGLYDWVIQNSVFSGAQFVEHAFHIDQGLPYQPLNLFLKILRAPKKPLFG